MGHCNGLTTPISIEYSFGTYKNDTEAKRYWTHLYAYVIGTMLHLTFNTWQNISFAVNHYARFNPNTKTPQDN